MRMSPRYTKIATAAEVDQAIQTIATNILTSFSEQAPLFVALLRGANPFASKLLFEIVHQRQDYHPEIDYMMIRTYGNEQHAGTPQIITDLAPSTRTDGRDIIILDDVLDKGITADFVFSYLKAQGAKTVKLAVLCEKEVTREKSIEADYKGFSFGDSWLVGMGMDDAHLAHEGYRWLEEIWEINR
jgi:hypoxanthine phosphoribosyltransferase